MAGNSLLGYHSFYHPCQPFRLRQENLKRLMAFSSISQAGYIMLGVIAGTQQGMASLVYYVLIYMFANLSVFAVITIIALRAQRFTLEEYNGLYSTNPKLAFLMTLALFSLAGIPPFAGSSRSSLSSQQLSRAVSICWCSSHW